MRTKLRNFLSPKLSTLNTITISREKFLNNIELLKSFQPQMALFPVLKSNAYGHGILQVLEIIKGQDFPYLSVDSYPEYQLVHKHSDFSLLLMGETLPENYQYFDHKRTAFSVYSLRTLEALIQLKKPLKIHLFINTGMNREGCKEPELLMLLRTLQNNPQISLEGVMSHFHSADSWDIAACKKQIAAFKKAMKLIEEFRFSPKWKHISNSSGLLQIQDPFFTAARPGLLFYGYNPLSKELPQSSLQLSPSLRLESTIVSLQQIKAKEGVSYGQKWKSKSACSVATIPFGYYEGLLRSASGKLSYRYQDRDLPQLGIICMNLSSCLADERMQVGESIEIISDNPAAPHSIAAIAEHAGTIPYEILIRLEKGIRRVVS